MIESFKAAVRVARKSSTSSTQFTAQAVETVADIKRSARSRTTTVLFNGTAAMPCMNSAILGVWLYLGAATLQEVEGYGDDN